MTDNEIILGLTTIVVLGVGSQWVARRLGFPSLLLLLPAGLVAGATGIVEPQQLFGDTLFPLVTLLVALLLFQTGLKLRIDHLPRPAGRLVLRLVTIGMVVTFAGATGAVLLATDVSTEVAFVLGAILVVSGPTVVGPLLRVIRPREPTAAVLAWEGSVLDPLGATLGVVVLNLVLASGRGRVHPLWQLLSRAGLGVTVGVVAAAFLVFVLSRFLLTDDMEAAVGLLVAVAAFAAAEVALSESGLFATITLGLVAANQRLVPTARISGFGETLEVLIIGTLFVLLGALVEIDTLKSSAGAIGVIVLALVLVIRPLAVGLSFLGTGTPVRDRAFTAWMAPRGIVAAATAVQFGAVLTAAGFDGSLMPAIAFGVILGTGLIYGVTGLPAARALGVAAPRPTGIAFVGSDPWVLELGRCLHDLGVSVLMLTVQPREAIPDGFAAVPMVSMRESEEELTHALEATPLARAVVATRPQALVTLVIADLIERLGRSNVLVVPHSEEGAVERIVLEAWTPQPFAPDLNLRRISERVASGAAVEVCTEGLPDGAIPLVAVRADGTVDLQPGWHRRDRAGRRHDAPQVVALTAGAG